MGKHDKLFRDPTTLSQREITFLTLREPLSSRWASEDGRKRATVLPPLEREPTFHRKPRFFNPNENHNEEAGESHWKKKYEKVSIEVDNKIKNHLKKQLHQRFEKRLRHLEDSMSDGGSSSRQDHTRHHWESSAPKKSTTHDSKDIFSKYTETGSKMADIRVTRTPSNKHLPQIGARKSSTENGLNGETVDINKVQFPDISPVTETSETWQTDSAVHENGISAHGEPEVGRISPRPDSPLESFREIEISPVHTPHLIRPMTREQTRLSFDDQMTRILHGNVNVTCPMANKGVRLYISSGFTDSEGERTFLGERLYPELQSICALHGRHVTVLDPRWGIRDLTTDDHSLADLFMDTLNTCTRDPLQAVNMVVLMTDRYGEPVLPTRLSTEQFQTVLNRVRQHTDSRRASIHRQIANIENNAGDRRRKPEISDSGTDTTNSDGSQTLTNGDDVDGAPVESRESPADFRSSLVTKREADVQREQQIQILREKESELPDPDLFELWYNLDSNMVPPVYRLRNISTYLKDFGKGDASRRDHQRTAWLEIKKKLLAMLNAFSSESTPDKEPYTKSMFAMEVQQGVLDAETSLDQSVVMHRVISDVRENVGDYRSSEFVDVIQGDPPRLDIESQGRRESLLKELDAKVPDKYFIPFHIGWAPGGVRVGGDRSHQTYLDRMSKQICDVIRRRMQETFKEDEHAEGEHSTLFDEISQHVSLFQDRSRHFQGMKESLQVIKSYVRSRCRTPLAVHGGPGCGKSALLAQAARETRRWLRGQDVAVFVRSVGTTKESCNIRNLLHGLCLQLSVAAGLDTDDIPTDYIGLVNDFSDRLSRAAGARPVVIYMDALDRLEDDHQGRKLGWLPKKLPANVHIVVSTLSHEKFECMPSLKLLLGKENDDAFLQIQELHEADATVILHHWCNVNRHDVTSEQFDVIMELFRKCPSPLFLKMLFEESLKWSSYTEVNAKKIGDSVSKMAAIRFGQLETSLGEAFVRRALGYLTAARNGVTDQEMLDLLSLDDAVMAEVTSHFNLVRRRVPPSLWLRLRRDLGFYVTEYKADNVRTLQWTHLHFFEAARDRYLKQRDKAPSYHKAMGEYFTGMWVEKPKPYPGNDKGVLRYVAPQPLYFEEKGAHPDGSERAYNLRKINELPFHLLRAQLMQQYKSETMCNFEWVLAKLCGTSLRSLVEEYHVGLEAEPSDLDLKTLSDTLQLSEKAIMRDPRQLAAQVVGRLQGIINRDVPSTIGDPPRYPCLHSFLAQAKATSIPALVPSIGCLTEPGGILYDLLSGHTKPITAVTTTTDGQRAFTTAEDNTMKIWDLKNGKVTDTVCDFGTNVTKLRAALDNKMAIGVEQSVIKVWCLRTKTCLLIVDQYLDPPVLSVAGDCGKLLVALFGGVNILRTWDLENECKFVCESKVDNKSVFSDDPVVLAPSSYGDYILHAFRGNNSATIQHARTGKVIHTLKCHDQSSSVVALAITRDYMVLACRQQYMKLHEIHQLELFDAKKGKYLRSVRGCPQDLITEMHINLVGSHAIIVCASEVSNSSNIIVWNLETEDHKHLAKHSGVSNVSACVDFRYCMTAQKGDNTLKIWNLSKYINQPQPKLKKALGVAEIHPMVDNPRYAIARQVNHGPISIWNVAKAKCLANAVRIERGLSESSDIVLIRNCNVVILTEKGLKDSKPVFKTVLIYDLRAKRYISKVTGCFIVPSPAHEYVLLDDIRLLGPSESRNHFIIWSLETGRELFRIKLAFRDNGRKKTISEAALEHSLKQRASTAKLTPWDRRSESESAKQKRRERERDEERLILEERQKEKQNAVEQFIISGDLKVIVASFYAHHLVVLNVETKLHSQTLEDENSMLFLHVAALNHDGSRLVHASYDEIEKMSCVTLWDTETGQVRRKLENETDVLAIAITDDATRVVFGKASKELTIWDPEKTGPKSLRSVSGYDSLEFGVDSKIFILNQGANAVVFAGDISLWDLKKARLLATFTPDTRIECITVAMTGQLITMGVHEYPELVVLKMMGRGVKELIDSEYEEYFGETTGDTSDEEDDEDD